MSLTQTTFGERMAEQEATIASLRALLATATNEIEQLTTTIDEKWVEQIDALTQENKKLKKNYRNPVEQWLGATDLEWRYVQQYIDAAIQLKDEHEELKSEHRALEFAFDIVKDENEVNKKNLQKMLMERPPLKSTDIVPPVAKTQEDKPEKKNTKNEKGNRKVVCTDYGSSCAIFAIPDGLDLEDKSVVQSWGTKYGTLYIKYVGKAEEEEIEWNSMPDEDYKYGNDQIVDAEDFGVFYSDDEEDDEEEQEEKAPFWEKPIKRDEDGNAIFE